MPLIPEIPEDTTPSADYPIMATVSVNQDYEDQHDSPADWYDSTGSPYWHSDWDDKQPPSSNDD